MRRLGLLILTAAGLAAQALDPAALLHPATGSWPTYNGDYTGQRFSPLKQINAANVASLKPAWIFQTHITAPFKGTPLEVGGILYFTLPDHVWAADARTGRQIWHYSRPSEGDHIGSRGVAMYKQWLYFGTPDAHLICLDARTGKPVWDVAIADVKFGYYVSMAPLVVGDRLIVGLSGDSADVPMFLESLDPLTGKVQWRWDSVPKPGEPGSETWPNKDAMEHGGGATWMTGTYDPELNLLYWGTGNPHPVLAGVSRAGANLYTCSIVAIRADTGKLAWYFQASPHDTQDRDANETPVIFDAEFEGRPRKLLAQASRNGNYFLLDRATGEHLLTASFGAGNWQTGVDRRGQPIPNPDEDPKTPGTYFEGSGTNWQSPSYNPQTHLFYVQAHHMYKVSYLTLNDAGKVEGHQGGTDTTLWSENFLLALDYETGEIRWRVEQGRGGAYPGVLTTAGGVLFTCDLTDNLEALDATTGKALWHVPAGAAMNSSPMTYQIDGRQYLVTAVDGVLVAWAL
jgi:alcohol dehydrogenase (cytochrome c)